MKVLRIFLIPLASGDLRLIGTCVLLLRYIYIIPRFINLSSTNFPETVYAVFLTLCRLHKQSLQE
jgi:hypothetical protein